MKEESWFWSFLREYNLVIYGVLAVICLFAHYLNQPGDGT